MARRRVRVACDILHQAKNTGNTRKVTKILIMPDIGDLLTSRPASCIQLRIDTQLLCKKIVMRIIAIVLSFEVDGDASLIYHKGSFTIVNIYLLVQRVLI